MGTSEFLNIHEMSSKLLLAQNWKNEVDTITLVEESLSFASLKIHSQISLCELNNFLNGFIAG